MKEIGGIELKPFDEFYETIYESSDTDYYAIDEEVDYYNRDVFEENIVTPKDLEFDYETRRKDIIDAFVETWKNYAPKCVHNVSNPILDSPKYYNFRNDEIYATVEFEDSWMEDMKSFIKNNYDSLKKTINEQWSDRDGFWSFLSNDIDDWDEFLFEIQDNRYISIMLYYMMKYDNPNLRDDIVQDVLEDICDSTYVHICNPAIKQKYEAACAAE